MQPPRPSPVVPVADLPRLPPRAADAHKGTFGRVLVVAGSRGMSGAAVLCASAALRGGAGLVRLALPASLLPIAAAANPCYMTAPLPEDAHGQLAAAGGELLELVRASTVAALGPGLGRGDEVGQVVGAVLEHTGPPLVLDADALHALIPRLALLARQQRPLVLTPHPGEFAALTGAGVPEPEQRQEQALRFAATHGVVLVLKGHRTVITDGRRLALNSTGNPGMATGGSGDVLTGLIAALLAQGLEAFAAAQLGVYLHGLAGDLACAELGEVGLIASDLLHYLPRAFLAHSRQRQAGTAPP